MHSQSQIKTLEILRNNKNCWVSGETIANKLGVSRTTVSNVIKKLKILNYKIDSQTNKGHRLTQSSDLLLPCEIKHYLSTKKIGQNKIHYFHSIDSTNIVANKFALDGAPHGTLIIAETQTGGKGRKNRIWDSPKNKGLYFSLIIKPEYPIEHAPKTTILAAVALFKTLRNFSDADFKIKWPNDILVNQKKISGILTEMNASLDIIKHIIIGIGVNINTEPQDFKAEIREIATSLKILTNKNLNRVKFLTKFLELFEYYSEQSLEDNFEEIIKIWKNNTNIINRKIKIEQYKNEITGIVKDITNEGILIIEDSDKKKYQIYSGDVKVLD